MAALGISPDFWKGRNVLVTGHTGFKGSWLASALRALGAQTTGISLPGQTDCLIAGHEWVDVDLRGDIVDPLFLRDVVSKARPDVIFHLAAQSLVSVGYQEPFATWRSNVMGTVRLLETLVGEPSTRSTVIVTSDKCYQPLEPQVRYDESSPLGGNDPYSASKAAAELAVCSFRDGLLGPDQGVATARAGNVLGGGDWSADRLVPDCIRAFLCQQPVVLRRPNAVRPWQHVLEPIVGYIKLAEELFSGDPLFRTAWNFGPSPSSEANVYSVAQKTVCLWGNGASVQVDPSHATFAESEELRINSAAARNRLGWTPLWDIDQALEATVVWYKRWAAGQDTRSITDEQVGEYLQGAVR